MNGSSSEPTRIISIAYAACGVPNSVWLRFEFSFMNGLFRADTRIILVTYAADSVSLRFEFSFMNGSSFEPILGSFWYCYVAARQELESQVQQAR